MITFCFTGVTQLTNIFWNKGFAHSLHTIFCQIYHSAISYEFCFSFFMHFSKFEAGKAQMKKKGHGWISMSQNQNSKGERMSFYELLFVDLIGLNICLICINTKKKEAFYRVLLIHTLVSQYNAKNKRDLGKHSLYLIFKNVEAFVLCFIVPFSVSSTQ